MPSQPARPSQPAWPSRLIISKRTTTKADVGVENDDTESDEHNGVEPGGPDDIDSDYDLDIMPARDEESEMDQDEPTKRIQMTGDARRRCLMATWDTTLAPGLAVVIAPVSLPVCAMLPAPSSCGPPQHHLNRLHDTVHLNRTTTASIRPLTCIVAGMHTTARAFLVLTIPESLYEEIRSRSMTLTSDTATQLAIKYLVDNDPVLLAQATQVAALLQVDGTPSEATISRARQLLVESDARLEERVRAISVLLADCATTTQAVKRESSDTDTPKAGSTLRLK
ncbi:hypothetical protein OPT61_g2999 [Boeremia exigua]|uniref:Uncharacterized protein n=1 Tax=Boeremia exigua TaxID=749465 RepID=A0ACC2IJI3_9PLEO|nr:hypothetical protein OPT61_g2999 [Boeremia exigua]